MTGGSPLAATTGRLRGGGSGRCLDVDGAATTSGSKTLLWDCHTAANQLWTSWAGGEIRVYGDKCLDASGRGTTNGTPVVIWPCNGQDNQKWTVGSDGSVRNIRAGLCLDAKGGRLRQRDPGHPVDLQRPEQPEVDHAPVTRTP